MATVQDALALITDARFVAKPVGELVEMQSGAILRALQELGVGEHDARVLMTEAAVWSGGYTAITPGQYRVWVPSAALRDAEVLRTAA